MSAARRPTGIGVWSSDLAGAGLPHDRHRAFVAEVEALGYGMIWVPEAFGREALTNAGLVLAASGSIMVGTGIANIWARDAVAMANGARTLGEAYPGRFVLGLGVSHRRMVESRAHDYSSPVRTLERYLEQMDAAQWTGPEPSVPVARVVGALGPRALALAAGRTHGVHPYLVTPDYTGVVRDTVGADAIVAPEQAVVLTDSPGDARRAARAHVGRYLDRPNYRNSFLRQGFDEDDLERGGSDRLLDALVARGDASRIRARVDEHLGAGADHVALQVLPTGQDDDPLRTLRGLAPHLPLS